MLKKKGITLHILVRILLSYCLFITIIIILNKHNGRLASFFIINLSALAALAVLTFGLKKQFGFNITRPIFIGYFIKLLIGYLFWEFYLFPDYFSNPISLFKFSHSEYLYTESLMKTIALDRIANGFFYILPETLYNKHTAIHYLMSNLYLSGSPNPLDISVQNTLFSTYTAVIILAISKRLGATCRQMKFALMVSIYQPFSMISSIIWREVVGQFFVAVGGYLTLIALNKKGLAIIILLIVASLSMLMERFIYFFFPAIAYFAYVILQSRNKYQLLFLPILAGILIFFNNYFYLTDELSSAYGSNITGFSLWVFLPINLVRLFIGPFPWYQWFNFTDNYIFQIADYFESVISISLLILCIKGFKQKGFLTSESYSGSLLLFLLFIPFIFSGLGTVDIHQGYMTTAVIFLIPAVAFSTNNFRFNKLNLIIFFFFICANILYLLSGLSGSGSGTLFR